MECAIAGKLSSTSSYLVNTRRNGMKRTKLMANHNMFYSSKSMISLPILAHTNPSLEVIPVILPHHYYCHFLFVYFCSIYLAIGCISIYVRFGIISGKKKKKSARIVGYDLH